MVNYDILDIRLFERVAYHGQLGPAAAELYMTISAASLRIKKLEEFFHVRFFVRRPRGLELTEAGRRFLEDAIVMRRVSGNLESKMRVFSQRDKQTIRFYVNYSSIAGALKSDIGDFLLRYPEYNVDFHLRTSEDILDAISNGDADIGIANVTQKLDDSIKTVTYSHDKYGLLVEEDNPLLSRLGETLRLRDLEDFPLVALNSELITQDWFESHAKERGLKFNVRARFPTYTACIETLKKLHAGMLVLESSEVTKLPGMRFIVLEDNWRKLENRICVKNGELSEPIRDLFNYLCKMAEKNN